MTAPAGPLPGDFFLTTISGDVGWLIRFGQFLNGHGFSHWEHAGIYVGGGQVVEAMPGGARLASLGEYDGHPMVWSTGRLGITEEQRTAVVGAARARIGTRYSFLDYLAIAAHRVRLPVPGLRRFIADSGHEICSQLVDRCYQDAGVQLFRDRRWNGYVDPASLYRLIYSPSRTPAPSSRLRLGRGRLFAFTPRQHETWVSPCPVVLLWC